MRLTAEPEAAATHCQRSIIFDPRQLTRLPCPCCSSRFLSWYPRVLSLPRTWSPLTTLTTALEKQPNYVINLSKCFCAAFWPRQAVSPAPPPPPARRLINFMLPSPSLLLLASFSPLRLTNSAVHSLGTLSGHALGHLLLRADSLSGWRADWLAASWAAQRCIS